MIQRLEYVLSRNIDSPLRENSVFYETFVVPPELKDNYPKSEKYSVVHHQAVFCKSGIEVFDRYEKDKIETDYFTIYYEETSKNTSNFFGTACRVKMGDYARQRLIRDYNSKGKTINYDGNTVDGSVSDFNGLIKLIAKDYGIDDTLLKGAIYLEILEKSKVNEAFKKVSSLNNQLADWLRGGIEATEKWKFTEENYDYIKFYVEPMYSNFQNKAGASGFPKQEVKYKPIIPVPFTCNEYKNMSDNQQGIAETGLKKLSEFVASFDEISTAAVFNIVAATPTIADDILFAVTFLVKNFIEDNMPDSIKNIYNQLKVLFKEVQDIISDIGSIITEKLNQEIAKINAFLCGILNGLISLVQLIIMLLAMIVDNIPNFELEKTSALELAKHQEKLEFIEDFVDLFDKNAKEFLHGIKKLFTDDKIWKDLSAFISGLAKKISNYNEYFWAYFIGGVAFELILDAVIAYFTGGSSLVAQASAKISRLTAKAEQAGAKALNFGKGLGRKIANSTKDLYKWLEKEFLELLEAIKNGRLANYLKTKFNQLLGREEEVFDELLDELGWEGKEASKRGKFLGREYMNNRQMKALEKYIAEALGDVGVVMRKGEDKFLDASGAQAGFSPKSRELFFRRKFTFYEAFHEIQHALEFKLLGKEAYLEGMFGTLTEQLMRTYKREKWVYDKIMEKKHLFNELELEHADMILNKAIKRLEGIGVDYKKL
ncbi:zincin-like metallopeptidase toxin domain-containing protein [Chryseobacterium sp.]|uniref:zincin-like metallopeptidase toxin domain-containing protein n=1 Tax=Chryseobacterium sp. TaxID=1871047 RepID=UPI002602DEAC|nr:zincin-like metallopeptidase toxin domain-containing protein [Chryseobacterium sp.]